MVTSGIVNNFIMDFDALANENSDNEIAGYIRVAGTDKQVGADIEVILVMKNLLTTGITKNASLAAGCRKFFLAMLKAAPHYITRKAALAVLEPEGYEEGCLYAAIKHCFGDSYV